MNMPELTPDELDALLEKIAKRAVKDMLKELGLESETAASDMREIRSLLDAWRDTKRTIRQSVVGVISKAFAGLVLVALAFYAKDWVQK